MAPTKRNCMGRRCFLGLTLLILAAQPGIALADGCMVAPWYYDIYERDQLAFIQYDAAEQIEHLHIMPKFYGDAHEFAWIVPTPALPAVTESDQQLFRECSQLSAAIYRHRDGAFDCDRYSYDAVSPGNVEIISEQMVGIYQTLILGASDASVLTDSLTTWGYLNVGGDADFTEVLDHYVSQDWYFVAMKVDSTALADLYDGYYGDGYYHSAIDPVQFSFATEQIVYPLRISRISAAPSSSVTLYVATDSKTTFAGATTQYANRITDEELSHIRRQYPFVGEQLAAGSFLTKLQCQYTPTQMQSDIVVQPAANNDEFKLIHYSGLPLTLGLFALASVAYGAWSARRRR